MPVGARRIPLELVVPATGASVVDSAMGVSVICAGSEETGGTSVVVKLAATGEVDASTGTGVSEITSFMLVVGSTIVDGMPPVDATTSLVVSASVELATALVLPASVELGTMVVLTASAEVGASVKVGTSVEVAASVDVGASVDVDASAEVATCVVVVGSDASVRVDVSVAAVVVEGSMDRTLEK